MGWMIRRDDIRNFIHLYMDISIFVDYWASFSGGRPYISEILALASDLFYFGNVRLDSLATVLVEIMDL